MAENIVKLGFWGVRGSTPTVDRANWRYGGNTSCLEIVTPDGQRLILDCGTGVRMLGNRWVERVGKNPMTASVFLSHYHWDHIQGLPFFAPLYQPQNKFHFYSFQSKFLGPNSLRQVLEAQMAMPYFPVDVSVMSAAREFTEITGGDHFNVGSTKVTVRWLNHPQGCLGMRFETTAGTIVYGADNEPGDPKLDKALRELTAGADIFINDAQYSPQQLATNRKGWGHSTWLEGVNVAQEVGAKHLVLSHHDPESSDKIVDGLLRDARQKFASVWAASEGMVMQIQDGKLDVILQPMRKGQRREVCFPATITGYSEDGRAFEEKTVVRELSLQGASLNVKHHPRLQSEVKVLIEVPLDDSHRDGRIALRGHVVRRLPGPDPDSTTVGVFFTEEVDPDLGM
ncbi:MAG TPA: MBL fold metallo-hydrolase [Candidatus Acidoferrales bacterium]